MNFLDEAVGNYLRRLCDKYDEPVLLEMEALAAEKGFPIVGRIVGSALEQFTRTIKASRVFEMGSGFGFSGYWFARAVGSEGTVFLTDGDSENEKQAADFLGRAGVWDRCNFLVGDAIDSLNKTEGEFDVIYCDIDKGDYPRAFETARERLRVGGLYICDNVLWSGRVAREDDDEWTQAIREHNDKIFSDDSFLATIVPIRDGFVVATKIS